MRKLLAILTITAATAFMAGCEVDTNFSGVYTMDNISVPPGAWKISNFPDGSFDCMYFDKEIRELTSDIIVGDAYITYFKYTGLDNVHVQEMLPVTVSMGEWFYTINAEYSERNLRITLRPSDFKSYYPQDEMFFRLAIIR